MRSVVALLAAVAMVVAALFVRSRADRTADDKADPLRLTCSTELESVCAALAGRDGVSTTVEAAGVTADRLVAADTTGTDPDLGLDAWAVPAPWPSIVDEARARNGKAAALDGAGAVLGRSPMVILAWNDRAGVLKIKCGDITLKCVGDAAAAGAWPRFGGREEWGVVKPLHGEAGHTASGLAAVSAATVSYFGRTDVAAIDLDEDQGWRSWFTALEQALPTTTPTGTSAVQEMLTKGPAGADIVIASEADAGPPYATSARRGELQLIYPSPVTTLDAVVVGQQGGEDAGRLVELVKGDAALDGLAKAGWRVPSKPAAAGVTNSQLPTGTGLPAPGVMELLRKRTLEVTR